MKTIGSRRQPQMTAHASGEALAAGARFSESIAHLAKSTFIPKRIYRSSLTKRPTNTNRTAWLAAWGYWRQREAVTEQISRPATLEDLKTLLRSLNANGVD